MREKEQIVKKKKKLESSHIYNQVLLFIERC